MFARTAMIAATLITASLWQGAGAQTSAEGTDCTLSPQRIHRESASRVVRVVGLGIDPMRVMDRVRFGSGTGVVLGDGLALPELIETSAVRRPWHGLYGQMVSPLIQHLMGQSPIGRCGGFLVETVEPGGAADRAGLRGGTMPVMWGASEIILGGDVIAGVNGRRLVTLEDAVAAVEALAIGEPVTISYLRDGEPREATVTIEARPVFESDLPPLGPGGKGNSK